MIDEPHGLRESDTEEGVHGDGSPRMHELEMWVRALYSFFNTRNHPLSEAERAEISNRDFIHEARLAVGLLLRCSQLTTGLIYRDISDLLGSVEAADKSPGASLAERSGSVYVGEADQSFVALAESVGDAYTVGRALCELRSVSFDTWSSFGRILIREFDRSEASRSLARTASHLAAGAVQPALLKLSESLEPDQLGTDMLIIFTDLARLLERLRFIETLLRGDYPLKQCLPIFTLVHEETRSLLDHIEARALRTEGIKGEVFDTLDGTSYAISMELRKAFEHELIGLSTLRQAPALYARVENAHGLLRDCFQQSIVALAQVFDPTLEGSRLFDAFQTKLDQSIALRRDLWTLLDLVRQAEKERDRRPVAPLLERLIAFRNGSLRYLMYKDWESYERFVEEVAAARGAVELAPVFHRFGAYLETLFGQIHMRAVLVEHPFDYPAMEE